ncbi:hypothetical protein [Actinomadura rayongensis]|uniref:Uncharacterized protein n=1 Tax=Actinomadura rayongensis TaxID=1429076 RepID=A0A6I4W0B2_9ACTN|nr:hypothetical protein [Actinomadura rayongensis]MXQ64019.1 hypothetical protein [Actinomadura rayongensis]
MQPTLTRRSALTAAALTAVLALGGLPAAQAAPPPGTWTATPAPALTAPSSLHGVAAPDPAHAFAVGMEAGETAPVLLRRVNGVWTRDPAPAGIVPKLVDVAAGSAANVWAVGQRVLDDRVPARAVHWNGRRWKPVELPLLTPMAVSVDGAGKPWVTGVNFNENDGSAVYRRRAGTWEKSLDLPAGTTLSAIAARSPRDVWAGGLASSSTDPTALYHFDGSAWTRVEWPGTWSRWVMQIAPVSAHEVWFYEMPLDPLFSGPALVHWKDGVFTEHKIPAPGSGGLTAQVADPGFLGDITLDGAGGVWLQNNRENAFLHFDGTSWTRVAKPSTPGYLWDLTREPRTGTVWAAGDAGTLLRFG